MSRADAARLKVNPPRGTLPALQYCAPGELLIDPSYQRSLEARDSVTLIRRIAVHWDWDLCQPLVVSRRANGALYVIDGQHRLGAARLRDDIAQLPCVIVNCVSAADEAASFVHLNQQRRPLTKLDLFRAAVASGDAQAAAITAAMASAGLVLAPHSNHTAWKPGMVSHIGGIERAWTREGQAVATDGLMALGRAFAGQVQRYGGTIYRGITRICRDEHRAHGSFATTRFERFVGMLARRSQASWMQAINQYFSAHPEMFRVEAAEDLMRLEWRREVDAGRIFPRPSDRPPPRISGDPVEAKAPGFGLGAGDWKGDAEWAWCEQCDARRTIGQVAACSSRFCRLKEGASR
ncbi:MAG: DUF6551 family protein [Sphingomonas sp.]